jgi:type III restriction enzyme, res subunit
MKLQFDSSLDYQLDAINAVVDVFAGQIKSDSSFIVGQAELGLEGQQLSLEATSARGNVLSLMPEQIINNVHSIQDRNMLERSEIAPGGFEFPVEFPLEISTPKLQHDLNLSIEMETGTGKTYVYLRTIHELHQKYGWKKFIIVVPSVAIREGVMKNLEITREHFAAEYDNPEMNFYVWDSKKTGQAREFATNDTLQIMVITIDSFAKAQNVMNRQSDYGRPLDFIKATHPVVILDEPQNMETDIRRNAIASLNPLCTLRYSATHKHLYNLLYRLTPVDAYDKGLVKKIEVHSVQSEDNYNDAYINVLSLERQSKTRSFAKIEVDASDEYGLQRKIIKVFPGDDLEAKTGRSAYAGYYVESINHGDNCVEFSNGKVVYVGQRDESLHDDIIKRQIELTIDDHFDKQRRLGSGVKVLSLFFIDKVMNYREYMANGVSKGKFAKWFEEAYIKVSSKPKYAGVMDGLSASEVHNGYFAADKNGQWKDSRDTKGEGGRTKDDDTAYNLIMKDKERLLDTGEPLRFIFSHSALREGWDNPNVFQICTLNETSSQMKKRQEIGRGLRLPVNIDGQRVYDDNVNVLTVVANESYADFSRKLQTEIEEETGINFGGRIKNRDNRRVVRFQKSRALDPAFKELWDKIKHKTTYRVAINTEKLVTEAANELAQVAISKPNIADDKTLIDSMGNDNGFMVRETGCNSYVVRQTEVKMPNLLADIQRQTQMTRRVIFEVLDQAGMFEQVTINPQQVIDETARAINRVKQRLAVDGVKYHRTGEYYDMMLFENGELQAYLYDVATKSGAIAVGDQAKTIYDYVAVDSEVEREFMQSLEDNADVKFYVKLPSWFKIDTPVGKYNPDWAVAFDGDRRIYFVAETKGSDDIHDNHLSTNERGKIIAARQHFAEINVPYAAPVRSLRQALTMVGDDNCDT